MEIISRLKKWFDQPYQEKGNFFEWFLFLGLVVIVSWFWSRVIARIG